MIIPIQPVQILQSTGTQFFVRHYTAILNDGGASAPWEIQDTNGTVLMVGKADMTPAQYAGWDNTDLYAINAFAATAGVTPVPAPVISSAATLTAPLNQPITFQIVASNFPTNYGVDTLPDGLTLDPVAGIISGTPDIAGVTTSNVTASNIQGAATQALVITVA